tara:strand:+ start:321 stop:1121 length:801 start_codon:yes stop_codon:yes gene_type:complete
MAYRVSEDGSYVRTVRCGYCYEKGHNRSACPKRKKDLKNNIERYTRELAETDRSSDDYQVKRAEKHLAHCKKQLHKMENRGKNRKCSFCSEEGHTRRTCTERKKLIVELTQKTTKFRCMLVERMNKMGLGIGSLINLPVGRDEEHALRYAAALITSINWSKMDHRHEISGEEYYMRTPRFIYAETVAPQVDRWGADSSIRLVNAPIELMMSDETLKNLSADLIARSKDNYPAFQILSGVDSVDFPDDFLDDKAIEKHVTKEIVDAK